MDRTPVSINKPFSFKLFGHSLERGQATKAELLASGFKVREPGHFNEYVEDDDIMGWCSQLLNKVRAEVHTLLHGPAGAGKNLTVEYLAHRMNMPYQMFAMKEEGGQIADWLGRTTLEAPDGATISKDVKGKLRTACEGCLIKRNGVEKRVPALVCFSDIDRANPKQVEILREALEVGKGQLFNPLTGETFPICPGTVFVFTSNRGLDGDAGRGNLTNPIDSSIGNRFRGVSVPEPTEKWERSIVQRANPDLSSETVKMIVESCRAVKKSAETEMLDVLQISVRDMIDTAREYKIAYQSLNDERLSVRFALEGTIQKVAQPENLEALRSAVISICGELKQAATPFDL